MNSNEIALRLRANIGLKIVLSVVLTLGILAVYLSIQHLPLFPVRTMIPTRLDKAIPFLPNAVYLYETICLLTSIAPWLMLSRRELYRYTVVLLSITLFCFMIFVIFPFSITRPPIPDDANALYRGLVRFDLDRNSFPSLHVTLAVFHGFCCHLLFSETRSERVVRFLIWLWVGAIVLSTLLTKQHYVYDVLGGTVMGTLGYLAFNFRKLFMPYLLESQEITEDIIAIQDTIVNFFVIRTSEGLLCMDSGWRSSVVQREFQRFGLDIREVRAVFLTHKHWEHSRCRNLYPNATVYGGNINRLDKDAVVNDGEVIQLGGYSIEAVDTPGHTSCSVSYLLNDAWLFSGDTLRIKKGKILPFYALLNSDNKLIRKSVEKIARRDTIKQIFTAHHGTMSNVKKDFQK